MSAARRMSAAALAALSAIAIAAGSRVPWTASPAHRALLRHSWRASSEAAERCRPLSEEEKADLPVHMRVPEVCETRIIPYLLEVRIDGAASAPDTLHGAGAREDRPVVVFREIPLSAGSHDVELGPESRAYLITRASRVSLEGVTDAALFGGPDVPTRRSGQDTCRRKQGVRNPTTEGPP